MSRAQQLIESLNEVQELKFPVRVEDLENQKIGYLYVNDVQDGSYIDFDNDAATLSFNSVDDDLSDEQIKTGEKLWDKMTSEIDKVSVKGKFSKKYPYTIYASYDGSGLEYWLKEDFFSFRATIGLKKKGTVLSKEDYSRIESEVDAFIAKVSQIVYKYISLIQAEGINVQDAGF